MNAPLSPHRPPRNYPLLALGMLGGLGFAAYLNAHLGDFTAERGWRAALQVAALAMALIENIQRENLNPLEEAQGIKRLIDEFAMTHEKAAAAVGVRA